MIYWTPEYVVYLDPSLEIDFEMSNDLKHPNKKTLNMNLNDAALLETYIPAEFGEQKIIHSKKLIGEAIACAIEGDYEGAKSMLASAHSFIQARSKELSRIWYLLSSGAVALPILVLAITVWWYFGWKTGIEQHEFCIFAGASAGAVGAFVSVLTRTGDLEFDCSSGKWLHLLEGASRIMVGFVSGAIVSLAVLSGLVLSAVLKGPHPNLVLLVAALAAGAGERFVGSILSDVNALGLKGRAVPDRQMASKAKNSP
jgi:hypothetical protein